MLKFYAALLLAAGFQLAVRAQTCAPPLAAQDPYIITNNTVPIEQYLARALSMDAMQRDWYMGGTTEKNNVRAEMDMAVELKAAILMRAAGLWGEEYRYFEDSYLPSLSAFVQEVNNRYDCAGVRRPIIQASVYTEAVSDDIEKGTVAPAVISEFASEIQQSGQTSYYFDAYGQPRVDRHYTRSLVCATTTAGQTPADVTRLEGRMWIYQQACYYLDAGFTSLHMGQTVLYSMGCYDNNSAACLADRQPKLALVAGVMRRIRAYYTRLPGRANAYLLLTSEPKLTLDGKSIKLVSGTTNGLDNLIFDWNSAAARPRETSPRLDNRRLTGSDCPYGDDAAQSFNGTSLAGSNLLMATIDPCHGVGMLPDGGGITPSGRVFSNAGATPYSVYLDFASGPIEANNTSYDPNEFTPGHEGVWGYDDARWFSYSLPASAHGPWTQVQLKRLRTFVESESFLQVTGRTWFSDRVYRSGATLHVPAYYLMADNDARQSIAEAWRVLEPEPQWQPVEGGGYTGKRCGADKAARPYPTPGAGFERYYALQMSVQYPDVTSIYTWHIQYPDGSWAPMTYGQRRMLKPSMAGTYHITLKQDNLGLPNGQTARTFTYDYTPVTYCDAGSGKSQGTALATTSSAEQVQLQVFPQPNTGQVTIQLATSGPLAVAGTVSDVLGRQVLAVAPHHYPYAGAHTLDLDLHALPAGVYTCQLTINGSRRTVKLVKN